MEGGRVVCAMPWMLLFLESYQIFECLNVFECIQSAMSSSDYCGA